MVRSLRWLLPITALCASGGAPAWASQPLEYPDNGAASFSRGGAWLAAADQPLAAHYNPATLAVQPSGASLDVNLAFNQVCFDRKGPGDTPTGPSRGLVYLPVCSEKKGFPRAVPSFAVALRLSPRIGLGLAVVPPATYGMAFGEWPATALGFNQNTGSTQRVPAPQRFLTLDNQSTLLYPTLSVGYALTHELRLGAGFIAGTAVIDSQGMAMATVARSDTADHARDDVGTRFVTRDYFVPGVVAALHWSATPWLDVALWGRYVDKVRSSTGDLTVTNPYFSSRSVGGAPALSQAAPLCTGPAEQCPGSEAIVNFFPGVAKRFEYPTPPEVRAGIRFHQPRGGKQPAVEEPSPSRDLLRDDVFDIEVDASYTWNSLANDIIVRFPASPDGHGAILVKPVGLVGPVADAHLGYRDSFGLRLGGQYNVIADKLGLRAGTWFETRSVEPEYLTVGIVGGMRGGFGGGLVLRQDLVDIQLGYQHHWNAGLDNHGNGALRAGVGSTTDGYEFEVGKVDPPYQQFRSFHTVNGGRVTQHANVFTLGGVIRF